MIAAANKINPGVIGHAYAIVDTWIEDGDLPLSMRDAAASIVVEWTVQLWSMLREEVGDGHGGPKEMRRVR